MRPRPHKGLTVLPNLNAQWLQLGCDNFVIHQRRLGSVVELSPISVIRELVLPISSIGQPTCYLGQLLPASFQLVLGNSKIADPRTNLHLGANLETGFDVLNLPMFGGET